MVDPANIDLGWVTYVEAATLAGMSVHWVRDKANAGDIRRRIATDGTRRRYVARADLEQLVAVRAAVQASYFPDAATPPVDGWLSLRDATEALKCSRTHVTKLMREGVLESTLIRVKSHLVSYVRADQVAKV